MSTEEKTSNNNNKTNDNTTSNNKTTNNLKRNVSSVLPTQKNPIIFITGNKNKLLEVQKHIGNDLGKYIINKKIDLKEMQGSAKEIVKDKLILASKQCIGPVMVEDTSLELKEYNGLPGPYIKEYVTKCGPQSLIKMLNGSKDRSATAKCIIGFMDRKKDEEVTDEKIEIFVGECNGTISNKIQGNNGFGWDPVFLPNENNPEKKSFAEITTEEKNKISHRGRVLDKFKPFIKQWIELNYPSDDLKEPPNKKRKINSESENNKTKT